ncbi:uncharacterized protein LOC142222387 isoform X2 [Haematobia irritans]|uniref:uncharacterized protein LOC142222387 isoform X2 n=1 Tax=Haematobia irritans TaxID=7368 RepID=UPI003F501F6B
MMKISVTFLCILATYSLVCAKSLFEYNINPAYDLQAEESKSYSNFWPYIEYDKPHKREKHYGHHGPDLSDYYDDDSSDSDSHEYDGHWHGYGHGHGHGHGRHGKHEGSYGGVPPGHGGIPPGHGGIPPGHGGIPPGHGGIPPGHGGKPPGHNKPIKPPRFPPPPVTDEDFINPWMIVSSTSPEPIVPTSPLSATTTIAPTSSATKSDTPPSSTTNADGLIYDIDVRFGE